MSEPQKYRKRPVVIEAMQWDGTGALEGAGEVLRFIGADAHYWPPGEYFTDAPDCAYITVPTLEGPMLASPGDWIIKGVEGETYPCKPSVFAKTYEAVVSDVS